MEALSDKQYKDYTYFSRYVSFPYYFNKLDSKYVYGVTNHLNDNVTYIIYKAKAGDT